MNESCKNEPGADESVITESAPKVNRRDFTRNVARFGVVGAAALFLGISSAKRASAGCTNYYQYTPVSACQSWVCQCRNCDGTRQCFSCGYQSHNNCAYYGLSANCCG